MQSSSKRAPNFYFTFTVILILVQIILFALTNEVWQILLLIAFAALVFYICFHFLFFYIQTDASVFHSSFFANRIILSMFIHRNTFLTVNNGKVDQDYFLLNTKPHRAGIFVHPDSAVVATDPKGCLRSLGCGFHALRPAETISTSFSLSLQTVHCGPEKGENPFAKRKSGENYTSFHARQLRAQIVRSLTADNQEIYPSFTIRYCLRPQDDIEYQSLVDIARFLSQNNFSGVAAPRLDTYLSKQICAYWVARVQQAPLTALLSGVDGNSFYNILQDINALLNPGNRSARASITSRAAISHLNEVARLKIPFIRVYLARVWYLDVNHSVGEEIAGAA